MHTTGRQTPSDFLTDKGRQLVADEPIQNSPGLLGIYKVNINGAGVLHTGKHAVLGDLVKGDPVLLIHIQPQQRGQVPADGLALPIRVRCQVHIIGGLGLFFQVLYKVLLAGDYRILRGKVMGNVHRQPGGGQIPHMAHRGHHIVPLAQIALNVFRLGRRLHNNQF